MIVLEIVPAVIFVSFMIYSPFNLSISEYIMFIKINLLFDSYNMEVERVELP